MDILQVLNITRCVVELMSICHIMGLLISYKFFRFIFELIMCHICISYIIGSDCKCNDDTVLFQD